MVIYNTHPYYCFLKNSKIEKTCRHKSILGIDMAIFFRCDFFPSGTQFLTIMIKT